MANKTKSKKTLKKALLNQVEIKLTESLVDIPKKISDKKFKKTIQKPSEILCH